MWGKKTLLIVLFMALTKPYICGGIKKKCELYEATPPQHITAVDCVARHSTAPMSPTDLNAG